MNGGGVVNEVSCDMCRKVLGEEDTTYGLSVERLRPVYTKVLESWPCLERRPVRSPELAEALEVRTSGAVPRRVFICGKCHLTVTQIEGILTYIKHYELVIQATVRDGWPQEEADEDVGMMRPPPPPPPPPQPPVVVGQMVPYVNPVRRPVVVDAAAAGPSGGGNEVVVPPIVAPIQRVEAERAFIVAPASPVMTEVAQKKPVVAQLESSVPLNVVPSSVPLPSLTPPEPQEPCCSKSVVSSSSPEPSNNKDADDNVKFKIPMIPNKDKTKTESRGRKRLATPPPPATRSSSRKKNKIIPEQPPLGTEAGYQAGKRPSRRRLASSKLNDIIQSQPGVRVAAAKSIKLCKAQLQVLDNESFVDEEGFKLSLTQDSKKTANARASRIRKSAKKISDAAKRHTRQTGQTAQTPTPLDVGRRSYVRRQMSSTTGNGPAVSCVLCDTKFYLDTTGDKSRMEKSWKLAQESLVIHFGNVHNPVRRNADFTTDDKGSEYYACTLCPFTTSIDEKSQQPKRNLRINAHVKLSRHYLRAHGSGLKSITPNTSSLKMICTGPDSLSKLPMLDIKEAQLLDKKWRECPHPECTFEASLPGDGKITPKRTTYRRVELKLARHYLRAHEFSERFKASSKHPCVKKCGDELCFSCPRCDYEKKFDNDKGKGKSSRDSALSLFLLHFYSKHVLNSTAFATSESAPNEPARIEPSPIGPTPNEPSPIGPNPNEPAPIEPAPIEPAPIEPAPIEPAPNEPAPIEPAPIEPAPIEPAPIESAPIESAPVEAVEWAIDADKKPAIAQYASSSQTDTLPPAGLETQQRTISIVCHPISSGQVYEFEVYEYVEQPLDLKPVKLETIESGRRNADSGRVE